MHNAQFGDEEVEAYQLGRSHNTGLLGFEHVGRMEEEAHLRNYTEHAKLVQSALRRVEERYGGRRRKIRAAVPSRVELKGIEGVSGPDERTTPSAEASSTPPS